MKTIKRIAAFVLAISFCFVLMLSPGANAQGLLGGQQFGAMMAAGLYATSILLNSLNIGVPGHFNDVCQWVHDPVKVVDNTFFDYNWPEPTESISEYLNRSIIKVNQGVTTIDGVEYDELWISPEGAGKVKANVFDFKTKWAIISNNAGTLATGWGTIDGAPAFNVNGQIRTPMYTFQNGVDNRIGEAYFRNNIPANYTEIGWSTGRVNSWSNGTWITRAYLSKSYSGTSARMYVWDSYGYSHDYGSSAGLAVEQPFQFDYTSGIVPADQSDIPDDYGISLKIPHEKLQNFYETYPQYDEESTQIDIAEDNVDIDDLTQAIFGMIDSLDEIKAEWTNGEQPEPPVPVDPIENIDQNVEDITQYQANMQQQIDHMHQDVEAIHQTQQQLQQTQQQIHQDTSSIDSTFKDATATPGQSDLPSFKFDLRELFPFCIPFDIYRLLSSFDATPQAPHVQLPIVIQSIGFSYTLDLDFSSWNPVAQAMRTAELIVYAIGLAWATGKVIKW